MSAWKAFTPALVAKHNSPDRLFIVRRGSGKCNVGTIESMNANGVTLSNGSWTYEVLFDDGPPKQFSFLDPPAFEVRLKDSQLPLR